MPVKYAGTNDVHTIRFMDFHVPIATNPDSQEVSIHEQMKILDVPTIAEWNLVESLLGERMAPTGWLRFCQLSTHTYGFYEREWFTRRSKGDQDYIWIRCH